MSTDLLDGIHNGDRRAVAKAITLVESQQPQHQQAAQQLLAQLATTAPATAVPTLRLGISGAPGVGKSTFIEAFGLAILAAQPQTQLAVLAIDPSSPSSHGSILGDKTRMPLLCNHPNAFVRPSPGGKSTGGISARVRESIQLLEAAGFDLIIIETIGVGQAEFLLASMVDLFLLLQQPLTGDSLQSMKKGIVELADGIVINKADGALLHEAELSKTSFSQALSLTQRDREPFIHLVSALQQRGLNELWQTLTQEAQSRRTSGALTARRNQQQCVWLHELFAEQWLHRIQTHPPFMQQLHELQSEISSGQLTAPVACERLMERFFQPLVHA